MFITYRDVQIAKYKEICENINVLENRFRNTKLLSSLLYLVIHIELYACVMYGISKFHLT